MITRLSIQALFIGLLTTQAVQAQKDASAILQLDSTTQGMLPPRMTAAQRDAIATPAQGLVIYNTDTNFYNYWNSNSWIPLSAGGSSTLIDTDSDTQIQVEESADEDIIRFDVGGNERSVINNNGLGIKATPDSSVDLAIGDSDTGLNQISDGKLALVTNGTQRMFIDTDGYLKRANYPAFRVYHTISPEQYRTFTGRIPFNTGVYDNANNVSAGVFTAPVKGIYWFSFEYYTDEIEDNPTRRAALYVNGTMIAQVRAISGGLSTTLYLNSGDTVGFGGGVDSTHALLFYTSINHNSFSGHLVQALQ